MIAVDDAPARDYPGGKPENAITTLGGGVAIKIMDGSLICHPKLVAHFRAIAEREGIPHQMEILPFGGTDAGAVQRQRGGIPAITLSIPCRYAHTVNEMASAADFRRASISSPTIWRKRTPVIMRCSHFLHPTLSRIR